MRAVTLQAGVSIYVQINTIMKYNSREQHRCDLRHSPSPPPLPPPPTPPRKDSRDHYRDKEKRPPRDSSDFNRPPPGLDRFNKPPGLDYSYNRNKYIERYRDRDDQRYRDEKRDNDRYHDRDKDFHRRDERYIDRIDNRADRNLRFRDRNNDNIRDIQRYSDRDYDKNHNRRNRDRDDERYNRDYEYERNRDSERYNRNRDRDNERYNRDYEYERNHNSERYDNRDRIRNERYDRTHERESDNRQINNSTNYRYDSPRTSRSIKRQREDSPMDTSEDKDDLIEPPQKKSTINFDKNIQLRLEQVKGDPWRIILEKPKNLTVDEKEKLKQISKPKLSESTKLPFNTSGYDLPEWKNAIELQRQVNRSLSNITSREYSRNKDRVELMSAKSLVSMYQIAENLEKSESLSLWDFMSYIHNYEPSKSVISKSEVSSS